MSARDIAERLPKLSRLDGSPIRALIVDDEPMLTDLVAMGVQMCGWEPIAAHDGNAAIEAFRAEQPDIVVLDWMLPHLDGLGVLAKMRAANADVPVLFLTAKDDVDDRIAGLAAGGDDYVTKPFSIEELLLRLHRLVERSGATASGQHQLVVGDLAMDTDAHEVTRDGEPIQLTATQFSLLRYLMENPRVVLSRSQILQHVWEYEFAGEGNIVDLYISYLRKKIDRGRQPMIHTVRGVGYVLKPA